MTNTMNQTAFYLGLLAIPVSVWRFQLSSRTALLVSGFPIFLLVGGSYYLNYEIQGAVMVLGSFTINILQTITGIGDWARKRRAQIVRAILVVLSIVFGIWWAPPSTWEKTLPFFAYAIAKTGGYALTPQIIRKFYLVSTTLWGSYAALTGNIPIFVMELLTLASNIVWLLRNPVPTTNWSV